LHLFTLFAEGDELAAKAFVLFFALLELLADPMRVTLGVGARFARSLQQFDGAVDLFFEGMKFAGADFGFDGFDRHDSSGEMRFATSAGWSIAHAAALIRWKTQAEY